MNVLFAQDEYSVNEGGSLEVCVVLIGNIELNITVMLSASELSDLPDSTRANCKSLCLNHSCYHQCIHFGL